MELQSGDIHVWSANIDLDTKQITEYLKLLHTDEIEKANRFQFDIHRSRFIAARGILRTLLQHYLNLDAAKIQISYGQNGKPYLADHPQMQFNLAHSDSLAVYAFTLTHSIGIDVEKMTTDNKQDVAARFFSEFEVAKLEALPEDQRQSGFYRIWARKEALVKGIGKGLLIPLGSFSVSPSDKEESLIIDGQDWHIVPLPIHPEYQAALASNQPIKKVSYWDFKSV